MASDNTEQTTQPTDPSVDEIIGIDDEATGDVDTEGHSMLMLELARTIAAERVRDGEKMSRDRVRVRDARPSREGGFLKRFGRR